MCSAAIYSGCDEGVDECSGDIWSKRASNSAKLVESMEGVLQKAPPKTENRLDIMVQESLDFVSFVSAALLDDNVNTLIEWGVVAQG